MRKSELRAKSMKLLKDKFTGIARYAIEEIFQEGQTIGELYGMERAIAQLNRGGDTSDVDVSDSSDVPESETDPQGV